MTDPTSQRIMTVDLDADSGRGEALFKALASEPRLAILRLLGAGRETSASVNAIARALSMPNSTAAMHIHILEQAGLVRTELEPASRGLRKVCYRLCDQIVVCLPPSWHEANESVEIEMPIGAYVDCRVQPTCGLASAAGVIAHYDDPGSFYDPARFNAQLIWFRQGYLEYRFPNRLPPGASLEDLQISLEICSEAPRHADDWPSDITLWINGREIGTWTSPADFGGQRGMLTPASWDDANSQYGLLKVWRVTAEQSFIDGVKASDVTLADLAIGYGGFITLRIGVKSDTPNVGGLNLFGKQFGNYPQDIVMRMGYLLNRRNTAG